MKHLVLLSLLACLLLADTVPNLGTQNPPEGTVQHVVVESNEELERLAEDTGFMYFDYDPALNTESDTEPERLAEIFNFGTELEPPPFALLTKWRTVTDSVWVPKQELYDDGIGFVVDTCRYYHKLAPAHWEVTTHYYLDFDNLVLHLTVQGRPKDTLTVRAE